MEVPLADNRYNFKGKVLYRLHTYTENDHWKAKEDDLEAHILFIDYKKIFDYVSRAKQWEILKA